MNETVSYNVSSINQVLDMLNTLTITGIKNANTIVTITRILQSPESGSTENGVPATEKTTSEQEG